MLLKIHNEDSVLKHYAITMKFLWNFTVEEHCEKPIPYHSE
jgi:hypothetical protein